MKKSPILMLAVLTLCLLSACGQNKGSQSDSNNTQSLNTTDQNISSGDKAEMESIEKQIFEEYVAKTNSILQKSDNKENYQTKIKKAYPEKDFFDHGLIYQFYNPLVSFQQYLYTVEESFPAECIRKTSETTAYNIYKTEENGLVYLFFQNEYEAWVLHHSVYVKKKLLLSDFASIKTGDSLESVGKIDPAALSVQKYSAYPLFTIHLLKDGVVKIDYEKNNDGVFVVSDLQKSKDFKLTGKEIGSQDIDIVYDYTILPQDYIQ